MPRYLPRKEAGYVAGSVVVGESYGYWTVISVPEIVRSDAGKTRLKVLCHCVCGLERLKEPYDLLHGTTKSCGCRRGALVTAGKFRGVSYPRWTAVWNKLVAPHVTACELCGCSLTGAKSALEHSHTCTTHKLTSACPECIRGLVCLRCNRDIEVFDRWGYAPACAWWESRRPLKDGTWQFITSAGCPGTSLHRA